MIYLILENNTRSVAYRRGAMKAVESSASGFFGQRNADNATIYDVIFYIYTLEKPVITDTPS